MAERIIAIKMTLDAGESVAEAEKMEKSLGGINDQVDELGKSGNKLEPFEQQFQDLNKNVDKGKLGFKEITKAIKEYRDIALKSGLDSPIGKEAIARASQLKDDLKGLGEEIVRTKEGGANMQAALQLGGTIAGGYSAFQGIMAAVGVENEQVTQTIVKLQAAQSVLMGIEQIRAATEKESILMLKAKALQTNIVSAATAAYSFVVGTSTGAMKLFRIALASTGIGAIIIGLGLLIANFDLVVKWVGKAISYFSDLKNVLLALAGPIGWAIMLYNAMGDSAEDAAEREKQARIDANVEATRIHKEKIKQLEEERAKQEEVLADLEAKSKRQSEMNDLEILQARARGASETEIFNITKRQNEENLKLAAEELAAKMKIVEINHQIAEAEYNRWKLFLETQATMSGWTEEQVKRDLQRLEDAKAQYLEDEAAQIETAQRTFDTLEAENKLYLNERNKQIAAANEKKLEEERKHQEKLKQLQADYNEDLTNQQIKNIEDETARRQQELIHRQAMELDAIRDKYGVGTELEKELIKTHNAEILALEEEFYQAEMDALEASIDAENALKEAEAEREEAEFQAKLDKAEGYIEKAQMAMDVMTELDELLTQIGEQRMEKNNADRDTELQANEANKKKQLAQAGLTAQQKAIIERNFALTEYEIKKKTAEANDKIAKRQFNRQKALQIAQASINTASAILQAIAQFGPPPSPMGIAGIVSAGVIGGIQIAKIASTKFEGESAQISPPDITIPNVGDTSGGGSGSNGGNQGGQDNGTSTLTAGLLQPKLEVSIVEIESVNKTVNQIADIGTL